jgi:hypothetical protein
MTAMSHASPRVSSSVSAAGDTAVEHDARVAAQRTGRAHLVFRDGAGHQVIHQLPVGGGRTVVLGRRRDCEVCLEWDLEVSRSHARLQPADGDWTISDEGSRNGSFVNRERVLVNRRLRDGDIVVLGRTSIVFRKPARVDEREQAKLSDVERQVLIELCRPLADPAHGLPADDWVIADRLGLERAELDDRIRGLLERFELSGCEPAEARVQLAAAALQSGVVTPTDL